jgi:pimeloyl-ACP methyl ester carboxylesterase
MPHGQAPTHEVKTDDGRILAVEVSGAADGWPVFLLHGTPGSRLGPNPRASVLYRLGVRLITYDRPGYGGSSRHEGRIVADAAADVKAIANCLNISRFSVVGRSGGGPHALACAALLPERVQRTAALVSVAPAEASGLDWFSGMTDINVTEYTASDADPRTLIEHLRLRATRTLSHPENPVELWGTDMPHPDRRIVDDPAIRRILADTYVEALREGPDGWFDDVIALRGGWGFALGSIKAPVLLWHGEDDRFSPVSHTRWLAEHILGAEMQVQRATAHFGAVEILPEILGWLTARPEHTATPIAARGR